MSPSSDGGREALLEVAQPRVAGVRGVEDAAHLLPHGRRRVDRELLGLVRHAHPALAQHRARRRLRQPREQVEQRALARAVVAHHPDLGARLHVDRDVVEQERPTEVHRDVGEGKERHMGLAARVPM